MATSCNRTEGSVRITETIPGEGSPTGTGTVEIDSETGRIAYKPATDFFGTETITYTVSDGTDDRYGNWDLDGHGALRG